MSEQNVRKDVFLINLELPSDEVLKPSSPPGNNTQKTSSAVPPGPPVYVDLAYVPNHCSAKNVDQEFFKRVRAAYYVVSGNDPGSGEPSRGVLDALLEGKAQWGSNLQVSLVRLSAHVEPHYMDILYTTVHYGYYRQRR